MQLLNDLIFFLANPPGNLVYILVVVFTLIGSLQGAISQWRASDYPQVRRMLFGLTFLLVLQVLLFVSSGLMEQNVFLGLSLLAIFDRAVILISLVWVIWIWSFPEPSRGGDAATALISLLVLAATVFACVAYSGGNFAPGSFNASPQKEFWNLGGVLISIIGIVLLFIRKPTNWGTGLAVLLLALTGFGLDMALSMTGLGSDLGLSVDKGDYSGIVRLCLLSAFPLLLTLPMRFPTPAPSPQPRTVSVFQQKVDAAQRLAFEDHPSQGVRERRRFSTDPKTLQSLLALASEIDSTKINQFIARSVAQAMLADLCFLIYVGEDKSTLFIATGYDLIREENLDGGQVNKESVPMLANAVLRGRPLRLPASTTSSDLKGLSDLLGLPNPGNLLNVPISGEKGIFGSILLLSPYSNRVWNADDQSFLTTIASSFFPIVERGRRIAEVEQDRNRAQHSVEEAQAQEARLQASISDLNGQIDALKNQLQQADVVLAQHTELTEQFHQLELEKEKLGSQIEIGGTVAPASSDNQLEGELRLTLQEMARLQNTLAESNMKVMELENRPTGKLSTDQSEVIASISQELRQPMSSIIGYADLLLGESVGILGALQRKFIERVRASTERIGSLIDDLIQITTLETGLMTMKPETVDLNLIIDNAMAYTSSQLREKNTSLRIDIPDNLQSLHADREALQQILIHLLQNAGAASPVEGSVTLRVRMLKENGLEQVMIQISDTGGGIPIEDMPRVFSRLYRAENVLIQGVGDTGVGLSIAKALTEAQGGQIRVDTEMNVGSTFSVTLPLKSASSEISQEA